ncbi:hypothetical protein BC936DRAFT_139299 [Jimgerdemannia flammicorona]|uniref:Uncharacterized protein n=2 Tax=Jimgerdemannia flammicorona TaxID=994334 RepID=A0A433Q2P9_9FUNG|nr:hypothetical protein BC936DRAFT_139299 [Jimgerdemannia flammicorona]RUS24093.1 hypothetical protein BC938DRAFT_474137 [Jimgerdemannia flammicorona]
MPVLINSDWHEKAQSPIEHYCHVPNCHKDRCSTNEKQQEADMSILSAVFNRAYHNRPPLVFASLHTRSSVRPALACLSPLPQFNRLGLLPGHRRTFSSIDLRQRGQSLVQTAVKPNVEAHPTKTTLSSRDGASNWYKQFTEALKREDAVDAWVAYEILRAIQPDLFKIWDLRELLRIVRLRSLPDKKSKVMGLKILFERRGFLLDDLDYNRIVTLLAEENHPQEARAIFEELKLRKLQIHRSGYSSLLLSFCRNDMVNDAFHVYAHSASANAKLSSINYGSLLTEFVNRDMILEAERVFSDWINSGLELKDAHYNYNVMIKAYRKQGLLDRAVGVFKLMQRANAHVDSSTYCSMISTFLDHNCLSQAKELLNQLHRRVDSDGLALNTSYITVLMSYHNRAGEHQKVVEIFIDTANISDPTFKEVAISVLLDSAGFNTDLDNVKATWRSIFESGFNMDTNNYTSLIEAMLRHGGVEDSIQVLEKFMPAMQVLPDDKTFSTLFSWLKQNKGKQVAAATKRRLRRVYPQIDFNPM